jgi:undecaprenyl-diphosphatase
LQNGLRFQISANLQRFWRLARKGLASKRLQKFRAILFQAYILFAALAFAALALLARTTPVFHPDVQITQELQTELPAWLGILLIWISWPGYAIQWIIILAVVISFLFFLHLRWEALCALFSTIASGTVNYLIKIIIRRPRPTENLVNVFQDLSGYSFPSGHVMLYTAFFGFLLFLCFTLPKASWRRTVLILLFTILIALVGVSRMYLGEHWASDVLGGYLLGSLVLLASIQIYRFSKNKLHPEPTDTTYVDQKKD